MSHDQPRDLLLTGRTLEEAQQWAAENRSELTEQDHRFLEASTAAEADRRRRRRNAILLRWLSVALTIALGAAAFAWLSAVKANREVTARSEEATSRAYAAEAATQLSIDPGQAMRTAQRALSYAPTVEAEDALRQAFAQTPPTAVLAHGDNVNSAVFDQQGDRLVTSSWDRTVRIWDTATGKQLRLLLLESGVVDARFSLDGHSVLTLTFAGQLALWRVDGPDVPLWQADGLTLPMEISHDGRRVLAVDRQTPAVKVIDVATGAAVLPPLAGHAGAINSVAFSADDGMVVTASQDGTARVWDTGTGQQTAVLEGHDQGAFHAAVRGDGRAIATSDGRGTVRIWQWPEQTAPLPIQGVEHGPSLLVFDPAGHLLAAGDKTPRLFNSNTGQMITSLVGHRDWVQDARFSQDGSRAVTASADGTARVWEMPSGRALAVLRGHQGAVFRIATDPGADRIATISGTTVRLFQVPAQQTFTDFHDWVLDVVPVNNGAALAASGKDGRVLVCDIANGGVLAQLQGPPGQVSGLDVDPTSQFIGAVMGDGDVWVWDWHQNEVVARLHMKYPAANVSFDGTGTRLVVATEASVEVMDWRDGAATGPPLLDDGTGASSFGYRATFSPAGDVIAVARGLRIQTWTTSGDARWTSRAHTGEIVSVAYSRDGRYLLTTSVDGTARTWRADTGAPVSTLRGHHGIVWSGAFDDRGRWVATTGDDGFIGVWNVATGRRLAWLPAHTDTVNAVRFTPGDNPRILTASDDTTVRISECDTCQPIDELRARADRLLAADGRVAQPPAAGNCFTRGFFKNQPPVDCGQEHMDEVYAVLTNPAPADAPMPSNVDDWALRECRGKDFRAYMGKNYDEVSGYFAWVSGPTTSAEWDLGQRWFACVLSPVGMTTTTGSARYTQ
jgi:WD40 repeat protein